MKKIAIQLIVVMGLLLTSCTSDSTDEVSKVTYYPNVTINGSALVVMTQGGTYTEAGAKSEAGGAELPTKTEGTVDTSKPGVYKIKYSAVNEDGFSAFKTRTVIVLSSAASAIDLSGTFTRSGNPNVVTKLGDRKYFCDNATGYLAGNPNNLKMEFYNIDDKQIYAPYQENVSETGISAESNIGTITNKDNWKWVIYATGFFGTAERVFKR